MGDDFSDPTDSEGDRGDDAYLALSEDELYRALAAQRRRQLLYLLHRGDRERSVEELSILLAGWEATERGRMTTADDRYRIHAELHHIHLPLLADLDILDYDREDKAVRLAYLPEPLAESIDQSVDADAAPDA